MPLEHSHDVPTILAVSVVSLSNFGLNRDRSFLLSTSTRQAMTRPLFLSIFRTLATATNIWFWDRGKIHYTTVTELSALIGNWCISNSGPYLSQFGILSQLQANKYQTLSWPFSSPHSHEGRHTYCKCHQYHNYLKCRCLASVGP